MGTSKIEIERLFKESKEYFNTGETLDIEFRINKLKLLKETIIKYQDKVMEALYKDLRKSEFESYSTEVGYCINSISHMIKNIYKWSREKKVPVPFFQFPSRAKIIKEPLGVALIIGPFNYPFQLVIEPLIGAIAAGNTAIIKPSEYTENVLEVIKDIIKEVFSPKMVAVVEGEAPEVTTLLNLKFDTIFFTGSTNVGKIVMKSAAENLTKVTLELGGKSPCIVDKSANIKVAAKRIAWGKFINAGQTCIATDYLIVHSSVKDELVKEIKGVIEEFYGKNPKSSRDFSRIINKRHFDRIARIIEKDKEKIVYGGEMDREDLYISPTILEDICYTDESMKEELFAPVLPVVIYHNLENVIKDLKGKEKPLALYLFSEDKVTQRKVIKELSFGGGCINDTISHVTSSSLPFGGVGASGLGAYHGKYSFDVFSHNKSVLKKSSKVNINLIFPPYKNKVDLVKKIFK